MPEEGRLPRLSVGFTGHVGCPKRGDGFPFILQFSGPDHLDLGDAIPMVAYVSTISNLFDIISVAMEDYSTQMV